MSVSRKQTWAALLWAAATDRTFERGRLGDRAVLTGKCIHCGKRHSIGLDGDPLTHATVEHIVPRAHGGSNAVENLAIACARCNQGKGSRLDWRGWEDPTLQRVTQTLQARRRERWREPLAGLDLPAPPRDPGPAEALADRSSGRGRRG